MWSIAGLTHTSGAVFRRLKPLLLREWNYLRIKPLDALFFLTYRCTSKCKTCNMWQRVVDGSEMDLTGWKASVDMCYDLGVRWIELFGGDALLRKDILVPLVKYIKKYPGMNCNMPTNCNLMDEETAKGLVEAGMDDIWISTDGVEETQDNVRGIVGSYVRVSQGVDALLSARGSKETPKLRINCTISSYNVNSFERVLVFAEKKGLDSVHLEYAGEFWNETLNKAEIDGIKPTPYFVRNNRKSCLLTREEALQFKKRVFNLKKIAKEMKLELYTENIDKLNIENLIYGNFGNGKCYIRRLKVTIDPYGYVLACPFYDGWKLGKIDERHLRYVWGSSKHRQFLKKSTKRNFQFCRYCVLGVQRNSSFFQSAREQLSSYLNKAAL